MTYSVGGPVDARTKTAIDALREGDWTDALTAAGTANEHAQVAELTGLLRTGAGGDQLDGWPPDLQVIARRTPPEPGEQAELGQDANWRYGASPPMPPLGRPSSWMPLTAPRPMSRTRCKETKACGAARLPSKDYARNSAWLQLAALAVSRLTWLRLLALDGDLAKAEPKMLRFRIFSAPARLVTHAHKRILKIPPGWAWADDLAIAWQRIHALHPA